MGKTKHTGRALKGSQHFLQNLVNDYPDYLNCLIYSGSPSLCAQTIDMPSWVSPLKKDDYLEYYDDDFLLALDQPRSISQLTEFWPKNGPVWDALAAVKLTDGTKGVILLEAKSYIGELGSPSYHIGAKGQSLDKINKSLDAVKDALGVNRDHDWVGDYYQFANRLAHLYFFNLIAKVPAWLVYLHFIGDIEQGGPTTVSDWLKPISLLKEHLGLPQEYALCNRIITVFSPTIAATTSSTKLK